MRVSRIARMVFGVAAAAATMSSPLSAQSGSMPFTIIAGINLAGLSDPPPGTPLSDKTGIVAGVGTSFELSKDLQFAPEVLFQMQGASQGASSISANYINVPLLFRFEFASATGVKPFFNAGPNIALRLSCSVSGTPGATCSNIIPGVTKDPKSLDFGLIFGGGLEFKSGTNTFGIGLRYQMGLTDVYEGSPGKNKAIQIIGTFKIK